MEEPSRLHPITSPSPIAVWTCGLRSIVDTEPLPFDFWVKVNQCLLQATRTNQDPAELLNKAGLLLTPYHDKRIRLEAMNYLLRQVTSWQPHEFLRRRFHAGHSASPADMYICVVDFIEEHIGWWEREQ